MYQTVAYSGNTILVMLCQNECNVMPQTRLLTYSLTHSMEQSPS